MLVMLMGSVLVAVSAYTRGFDEMGPSEGAEPV